MIENREGRHRPATVPSAGMNRRPQMKLIAPAASPEEAAAVVAALERFMRETAPPPAPPPDRPDPWQQAALQEGVTRAPEPPLPWA
jgi:hypothetical protein